MSDAIASMDVGSITPVERAPEAGRRESDRLVSFIGWMSIGFGVFDWAMADRLADGVGMDRGKTVFRAAATREVLTGLAAVRAPSHAAPIAARLVGDIADLGVLAATAGRRNNPKRRMAVLGVAIVAAVTVVDLYALLKRRRGWVGPALS